MVNYYEHRMGQPYPDWRWDEDLKNEKLCKQYGENLGRRQEFNQLQEHISLPSGCLTVLSPEIDMPGGYLWKNLWEIL